MNSGGVYERLKKKRKASRDRRNAVAIGVPKNKGGRPKKRPFNFNKNKSSPTSNDGAPNTHAPISRPTTRTTQTTRSTSSNNATSTSTSTSTARRSSTTTQPTQHTRSRRLLRVNRPQPNRYHLQVFANNQPPRENNAFKDLQETAKQQFDTIKKLRKRCREAESISVGTNPTSIIDPPVFDVQPAVINDDAVLSTRNVQKMIKQLLRNSSSSNSNELQTVFRHLGCDVKGRVSDETHMNKLAIGMRLLLDLHFHNCTEEQRAHVFGKVLFNGKIFNQEYTNLIATTVSKYVSTTIFSSVSLLKAMDMSSGGFNQTGIRTYAHIQNNSGFSASRGHNMLHDRWKVGHSQKIADDCVNHILHVEPIMDDKFGEVVRINTERAYRLLLKVFGLEEKAINRGILICVSGDGALLDSSSFTMFGLKIVDVDAKKINEDTPLFKRMIQGDIDEEEGMDDTANTNSHIRLHYEGAQSTDTCFPLVMALQNETTELMYDLIGPTFKEVLHIWKYGLPARGEEPEIPGGLSDLVCAADMSFNRKAVNAGGAFKGTCFACPYCPCRTREKDGVDHDIFDVLTGDNVCEICVHNGTTKCPHRAVSDEAEVVKCAYRVMDAYVSDHNRINGTNQSLHEVLLAVLPDSEEDCYVGWGIPVGGDEKIRFTTPVKLKDTLPTDGSYPTKYLHEICKHLVNIEESVENDTTIHYRPNDDGKENKPSNIEYNLGEGNDTNNGIFKSNLYNELRRREYPAAVILAASSQENTQLLRQRLELRVNIRRWKDTLEIDENAQKHRLIHPGQAAPCVLHAHVRGSEKITQQLLVYALKLQRSGAERDAFIQKVVELVNTEVLERSEKHKKDKSGWKFPIEQGKKDSICEFTFANNQARKFTEHFDKFVGICLEGHDATTKSDWLEAVTLFREVSNMLDDKKEYTKEEVYEFQKVADQFCKVYIKLTGRDGMTNYIHMLHAGHYSYFLLKYGNLYRLSQQGWENVNGRSKRRYFNNTQRGGGRGKKGEDGGSGKLLPIMQTMGREMLWKVGYLDAFFKLIGHDDDEMKIDYGKVKPMPKYDKKGVRLHDDKVEEFSYTILKMMEGDEEEGEL